MKCSIAILYTCSIGLVIVSDHHFLLTSDILQGADRDESASVSATFTETLRCSGRSSRKFTGWRADNLEWKLFAANLAALKYTHSLNTRIDETTVIWRLLVRLPLPTGLFSSRFNSRPIISSPYCATWNKGVRLLSVLKLWSMVETSVWYENDGKTVRQIVAQTMKL